MVYFVLSVLCAVLLFVLFRLFGRYGVDTWQAIVTNYGVCVLTGMAAEAQWVSPAEVVQAPWAGAAVLLGILFVSTFYLIALTTQYAGVTVATVSNKISMVIPVMANVWFLGTRTTPFGWPNYLGLVAALAAVVLTSRKEAADQQAVLTGRAGHLQWLLPAAVFVLGGTIDTTFNYATHRYVTDDQHATFAIALFGMAFAAGMAVLLVMLLSGRTRLSPKAIGWGILLGVPNYFSIFFLLRALHHFDHDGALLYPLFNISTILVSALVAVLFFGEKLSWTNRAGLLLAVLSIWLLAR